MSITHAEQNMILSPARVHQAALALKLKAKITKRLEIVNNVKMQFTLLMFKINCVKLI